LTYYVFQWPAILNSGDDCDNLISDDYEYQNILDDYNDTSYSSEFHETLKCGSCKREPTNKAKDFFGFTEDPHPEFLEYNSEE